MLLRPAVYASACLIGLTVFPLFGQTEASPITREGGYFVQTIEGSVAGRPRLRVSAVGDITVQGQTVDQVAYRIRLRVRAGDEQEAAQYFAAAGARAVSNDDTTTLGVGEIACRRCNLNAEIEMTVPSATQDAMVATRGGDLNITGIEGRVNADTAGGLIALDQIGGEVIVTTGGGNIQLGSVAQNVRCETAGGSITLTSGGGDAVLTSSGGGIRVGRVEGRLQAETAGGNIRAEFVGGRVSAGTSGGSIIIGEAGGEVSVDTAGGTIHVSRAPGGIHAETASGNIRLHDVAGRIYAASAVGNVEAYFVSDKQMMDSLIEANAGSVILFLPVDMRVTIEAMVDFARNMRRIESDFPDIQVSTIDGFGGIQAVGHLNGGGPVLRVRNTSGRILIRRRE